MRPFERNLIASAKPLGRQRSRLHKRPNRSYRRSVRPIWVGVPWCPRSSAYRLAHSALAKRRPKKKKPPRRAARRSHRLSNCVTANLSGIRAAGLDALTRFFAVGAGLACADSPATFFAGVAIAV